MDETREEVVELDQDEITDSSFRTVWCRVCFYCVVIDPHILIFVYKQKFCDRIRAWQRFRSQLNVKYEEVLPETLSLKKSHGL